MGLKASQLMQNKNKNVSVRLRVKIQKHASGTKRACSVSVGVCLEGSFDLHTDVVCLFLAQCGEFGTKRGQVQAGNLLVQVFGQQVHLVFVCLCLLPVLEEIQLRKHLICERAGHDERRMTSCAAKVAQTPRCQDNDTMTIWEDEAIHLWLDVLDFNTFEALQACHVDLIVKVTNVADDGVILHLLHVLQPDDVEVACC